MVNKDNQKYCIATAVKCKPQTAHLELKKRRVTSRSNVQMFSPMFRHCLLDDRKNIRPIKVRATVPPILKSSLLDRVEK